MTDEEKKPYHTIMVSAWRLFIKERDSILFSDEWWEDIIGDYNRLGEQYKGTPYYDYCGSVSMAFLDEWERKGKELRRQECE